MIIRLEGNFPRMTGIREDLSIRAARAESIFAAYLAGLSPGASLAETED
jgi:hypothetical protein